MKPGTTAALDQALPKSIALTPFTLYEVHRLPASMIERVVDDGQFALLRCSADEIELRFRTRLMATEPEEVYREWPRTWWDAFKRRWFPRWALRRWPVRMDTVHVTRAGLYPELAVPPPTPLSIYPLPAIPYLESGSGSYLDRGGGEDD